MHIRYFRKLLRSAIVVALYGLLYSSPGWSHGYGDGYVFLRHDGSQLHVRADLPLSNLADSTGVSPNPSNVAEHMERFVAYVREHLAMGNEGVLLDLRYSSHETARVNTGSFLAISFEPVSLPDSSDDLNVRYTLFFDEDAAHRGVLLVQPAEAAAGSEEGRVSLIFSPGRTEQTLSLVTAEELDYRTSRSGGGALRAMPLAAGGVVLSFLSAVLLGHGLSFLRRRHRAAG